MNENHDTRPEMDKIMNEYKGAQSQAQASASKTQSNFNMGSPVSDLLRKKKHDIPKLVFSKTMTPLLSPVKIELGQDGVSIPDDDDYQMVN